MFDPEAFRTWSIGAQGRAPQTMRGTLQRLRCLERVGFDVQVFLRSPRSASRESTRALAALKDAGGTAETARSCGKALNWLLVYAAHLRPGPWPKLKLEPERRTIGRTVSAGDLARLALHVGPTEYVTRLRRALLAVAVVTRLRRSEVARLRLADLRQHAGEVWVEYPAKRGPKRAIVVPKSLWRPGGPLMQYLEVREPAGPWLWTMPRKHGRARAGRLSVDAVGLHFWRLGQSMGVPISFVRTRRFAATLLDDLGVHPRVIQHELGHHSLTWTLRYLGEVGKDRILSEYARCGVPGFEAMKRGGTRAERLRAVAASRAAVLAVLARQSVRQPARTLSSMF